MGARSGVCALGTDLLITHAHTGGPPDGEYIHTTEPLYFNTQTPHSIATQ